MPAMRKSPAKQSPGKPAAPKKPSTRSKTGNSACSQAASNWQLAIRGKAPLDPDTYKTLGKCRAMSRSSNQAAKDNASGKLSDKGQKAVEGRLQSRFDRGLITKKSRAERVKELLAKRSGKTDTATVEKTVKARLAPTSRGASLLRPVPERPKNLTQAKQTVRSVKAKERARAENQSGVQTLKTSQIQADPDRFQYKQNTSGPVGVTDQFKETKVWNKELAGVVQVWKDNADGRTYVVNGHHRFELAQRLGVGKLNVQYIKAANASEARQKGALTNIAEGRGTSVDAGKFFRETNDPKIQDTLASRGISLSERTASEGIALSRVAPRIWRRVIDETTPISRAVSIGKSGLREEDQLQLFNKAEKGNWTASKTLEFGNELKRAPLVKKQGGGLFDDDEFVNVAEQRAQLAERFKGQAKSDLNLFGKVARNRNAGRLEQVGKNRIDVQSSAEQARQADVAIQMFDIERNYGQVSKTLDNYAKQIAGGKKIDRVYPEFRARVGKLLDNAVNKETRNIEAARIRGLSPEQRREAAKRRRAQRG